MPNVDKQKQITSALQELSASKGGSLVKEVIKSKMKPEPMVFIGLGGLGGKTLERLKNLIKSEYEDNPHCAFLAIDTAQNDLADRKDLDLSEKFEIYDPTCITLPSHPPAVVKSWLNPQFPKNNLKSTGAEGTRQVARLMLCGTDKYEKLRSRISSIINEVRNGIPAGNDWVRINLIAGISGGTGSGTAIDVAYMIHDIMNGMGIVAYDLRGFFYLPDAQKNVPEIQKNAATWANLQRNGYAALKEIDYFMTNGKPDGSDPVYHLQTDSRTVDSSRKIFEVGDCMIVSSVTTNGAVSDVAEMIERLSSFIAYIFTDMSSVVTAKTQGNAPTPTQQAGIQDILSTLCNLGRATLPSWKNSHVSGTSKDDPNWAGYHYSAVGYSSMYIPRDEIFAYCANSVFVKMYEEWQNISILNQENIDQQLTDKGLDSLDNVFKFVRKQVNSIVHPHYRIGKEDPSYPEIVKILGIGKTKNTDATMQEAADRARKLNRSLNTPATMDAIVKAITDEILTTIKNYFTLYGPFYAIAMISGLKGHDIKGFLQRIDEFKTEIPEKTTNLKRRMEAAKKLMEEEEENRRKDMTPSEGETEEFITACEKYTSACADVYLIQKLGSILDKVYEKLNKENSETYEIYTTTIEVLGNMLHQDSIFATDTTRTANGKGETFYFDAIGFKKSDAMRAKFLELFSGVIDDDHAQQLANEFKDNMFSESTAEIWRSAGEDREAFAQNIRDLFKGFFAEYTTDTLEKFLVLANSNEPGLTPQRLTEIWDATEADDPDNFRLRNNLIDSVADTIYNQLSVSSAIMMRSNISLTHINSFPSNSLICLINSMPKLNDAMRRLHPEASYADVDRDFKSSITMFEMRSGIPAATIQGMSEYANEYYKSEKTPATKIGKHMDEGDQKWDYYLPEIYGLDADTFYADKGLVPRLPIEKPEKFRDLVIMQRIRDCVRDGLAQGWICVDDVNNPSHYNIYRVKQVHDEYANFKAVLERKLMEGSFKNIWEIASGYDSGIVVDVIQIVPADSSDNDLDILQIPSNDYRFFDIHRVFRKNMTLMKALFDTHEEYEKPDSIINVYSAVKVQVDVQKVEAERNNSFSTDVNNFVKMFCFNLIKFDDSANVWLYRSKDTAEFKPLLPLNKGMMELDKAAIYYLAFVKGYIEKKKALEPIIDTLSNPVAPKDVYEKANDFLTSDRMTNLVEEERFKDLEDAVKISPYKDYYDYPYMPNGIDSTYRNLYAFYKLFVEYLRNYLG